MFFFYDFHTLSFIAIAATKVVYVINFLRSINTGLCSLSMFRIGKYYNFKSHKELRLRGQRIEVHQDRGTSELVGPCKGPVEQIMSRNTSL